MNSSGKVFYGGNTQLSWKTCRWIEHQSEWIGRHIHHALCGHGGKGAWSLIKNKYWWMDTILRLQLSINSVDKTRNQYYPDEIDMLKDVVSIPGISMTYMLNKALKMKKPGDPDLYALGQPCKHKCNEEGCLGKDCKDCNRVRADCTQCAKNKPYELLKTRMVGGPSIVFCRYAEVRVSQIRSHIYPDAKICKSIDSWDANSLYLCCYGQEMPCGKESYIEVSNP